MKLKNLPGMKVLPDTKHHYMIISSDPHLPIESMLQVADDFLQHASFKKFNPSSKRDIYEDKDVKIVLFGKEIEYKQNYLDIIFLGCDKKIMSSVCHDGCLLCEDEIGRMVINKFRNDLNSFGTFDYIACIDYWKSLSGIKKQLSKYAVCELQ